MEGHCKYAPAEMLITKVQWPDSSNMSWHRTATLSFQSSLETVAPSWYCAFEIVVFLLFLYCSCPCSRLRKLSSHFYEYCSYFGTWALDSALRYASLSMILHTESWTVQSQSSGVFIKSQFCCWKIPGDPLLPSIKTRIPTLAGALEDDFYFPRNIGNNHHPNWFIFFQRGRAQPPTRIHSDPSSSLTIISHYEPSLINH